MNNPLNAGFIVENTKEFVFAKYPDCLCSVYSLDVSDEVYENMKEILSVFFSNKDKYRYNFLGAIPLRLGIKWNRKYHFTCSQFVAFVLQKSGAVKLPKHYSLMMPNDFLTIKEISLVYKGKIGDCKIKSPSSASYVENSP